MGQWEDSAALTGTEIPSQPAARPRADLDTLRGRGAARALARHGDRPPRQPRAGEPLGGQGGRPPGVERVDGEPDDRALVLRAARRGPRVGQAARLARAARDQLPARAARARLPRDAARASAAFRATRAAPRTPTRSTTRPARSASAPRRRSGARSRAATSSTTASRRRRWGARSRSLGDAELDEGAIWEAIADPWVAHLGEVLWVVDLNRQSLDRVVPDIAFGRLAGMFEAAGWQVLTVKYGRRLEALFERAGGAELRERIDEMPNEEYQRLLRAPAAELRERLPGRSARAGAARGRARRRRAARRLPRPRRPRPRQADRRLPRGASTTGRR